MKGSCNEIKWHYLGRVFRNKVKILLGEVLILIILSPDLTFDLDLCACRLPRAVDGGDLVKVQHGGSTEPVLGAQGGLQSTTEGHGSSQHQQGRKYVVHPPSHPSHSAPPPLLTPSDKLGCSPAELGDLVQYLLGECPHLDLCGLMTVGRFGHAPWQGQNPDFAVRTHTHTPGARLAVLCLST